MTGIQRFPELSGTLQAVDPLEVEQTRSGEITAALDGKYLHSRVDPGKEARRFVDACALDAPCIITLGLGLGYIQNEILRRVSPETKLIIFESNPRILRTAVEAEHLAALFENPNVELFMDYPEGGIAFTKARIIETPAAAGDPAFYARLNQRLIVKSLPPRRPRIFANVMNGLGDLILTAPTLRGLKLHFDAEITALCWPNLVDLANAYPCFDRLIPWQDKYNENNFQVLIADIAALGPFDLALDFAFPPASSYILQGTSAPIKMAIRPTPQFGEGIEVIERSPGRGVLDETFRILDRLKVPRPAARKPDLFLRGEDFSTCKAILDELGPVKKLILIHPGAGGAARRWPVTRFANLADRLAEKYDATILFLGGRAGQMNIIAVSEGVREEDTVKTILKTTQRRHFSAAGRDNTRVLALLLEQADLFIGNNSGPAHLSGQLGCRTLVLWGPSDPREWSPVGPDVEVAINVAGLERGAGGPECFPCTPIGCDTPVCMEQLTVSDALAAIERRWPGLPKAPKRAARAVEIGAGERPCPGYLHVDRRPLHDIEIVADVVRLPLTPGSARQLRAQHIIEHFPMNDVASIVRGWVECLEIGGSIEIVTPNLGYIAHGYVDGTVSTTEAVLRLYGEQNYPGNFHYNLFDRTSLKKLLEEAGCDVVYDITRRYENRRHPMSLYMLGFRGR